MRRKFTGRTKITIPVSSKDFNQNPLKYIKHYLSACISKNNQNYNDYTILNDYYKGLQDILQKTRLNGDEENNNQIVVNHLFRQVEFKKGFMVGNPISYSLGVSDKSSEALTYYQKYLKDSLKASKDIDKYESLYIGGIALQYIIPRKTDYDKKSESPFLIYNVEIGKGFKVYSSDISSEPLFDVVVSEVIDEKFNKKKVYDVFYIPSGDNEKGYCYCTTLNSKYEEIENTTEMQPMKFLPLIEYQLNKNRMGIVELVLAIQDGLNIIQSNQIDDIVDFVNSYLVFENQDLGEDWAKTVKEFRTNRAILLTTKNPQTPAKLSLLKQAMQHTEINSFFELMVQEMYDIVACPKTSGGVTSGGDTGQARILGNGWESAQNQAQVDISFVLQYEYEFLKKSLSICKEYTTFFTNLNASDVDIKYSINMSNNILTKTQALSNLYNMHVPYEDALNITGVTNDPHGLAEKWAKNDEEQKTIAMKMQTKNLGENQNQENKKDSNAIKDSEQIE